MDEHNRFLVNKLNDLKKKRAMLDFDVSTAQNEIRQLEHERELVKIRLQQLQDSSNRTMEVRKSYNALISNTETQYMDIVSKSDILLSQLRSEVENIAL